MQHIKLPLFGLALGIISTTGLAARAQAQEGPMVIDATVEGPAAPAPENPIPPYVEGQPVASQGGGYCYGGPHPAPGGGWEAINTPHTHDYAPFDLRLFSYHQGCYYFIGDPRDFGYTGTTYSYYGAHPVADSYGGGWCFMIGAHNHWWRPWSPYFTVVGPWYYWNGPYDPFFWSYWPYYSFYYRSYYPSYYAGGRYYRTWRAAPAITRVPPTSWRGSPAGVASGAHGSYGGWRGSPAAGGNSALRSYGGAYGSPGGGWRGTAPAPGGGSWHGGAPSSGGGWHGSPVPSTSSPLRAAPSPGGGWHGSPGGSFHAPSGGGWHGSPGGSFGGGFRGGGGGGSFRGGGGWHGGRR